MVCLKGKAPIIFHIHTQSPQGQDMGIEAAATDHIAARRRQFKFSDPGRQWTRNQNGSADAAAKVRVQIRKSQVPGSNPPGGRIQIFNLDTQALQQLPHHQGILDLRNVV